LNQKNLSEGWGKIKIAGFKEKNSPSRRCTMTIEQIRAHIVSSVWQAIAQSGVDLRHYRERSEPNSSKVADNLLATVDNLLKRRSESDTPVPMDNDKSPWEPAFPLVEKYLVATNG
jgi:hypothetical protein